MATSLLPKRPPRLGLKQVFLPNFVLTLIRTEKHPPTQATFLVPLNLNKLDLRDYLWNAYGVKVNGVRSFIQQQKIRQDRPGALRPRPRKWHRPRAIKKMIVELDEPFVWPEKPEDFTNWDKKTFDAAQDESKEHREQFNPDSKTKPTKERASIAQQAKALLAGKEQWKTGTDKSIWEDVGEAEEVETDVVLPKI